MKVEVGKIETNKLVNVSTVLNNLKTKVDALHVGKLKALFIDLEKFGDIESEDVFKNNEFNKLNLKVNGLENKIPDANTLIHINLFFFSGEKICDRFCVEN